MDFKQQIGIYFTLSCLFLNILLLLNVVVAIMTDTYEKMRDVRKGLFNYNIVRTSSAYKMDKYYGGLISVPPPLCLISFLLIPFYLVIKDKATLLSLNNGYYKVQYLFIIIPCAAIFIVLNLLMTPFAYLKTCLHKINLLRKGKSVGGDGAIPFGSFLFYILAGLPFLLISQLTDIWAFLKQFFS